MRTAEEILKDLIHPDGMIDTYADEVIEKFNEAVKEAIEESLSKVQIDYYENKIEQLTRLLTGRDMIIANLQSQSNNNEDKWIDITKNCPDYDEPVLWLREDGNMFVESLDKDGNSFLDDEVLKLFDIPKVKYWQPLPPQPTK